MNLSSVVDLAGGAATGILYLLLALSAIQLAILVERAIVFIRTRASRRRLAELTRALHDGKLAELAPSLATARSLEERVLAAGVARAADGPEAVDEILQAQLADTRFAYEKRLAFLATLGNNAPFIGLFGTVLGIIRAFHDLAGSSAQGTQAVMSGIAEALVATGVGLLVALPAVATYNAFVRRIETTTASSEAIAHHILAHLKSVRTEA
jgi:biopolymer transport protein ExbB/TolQ